MIKKKPKLLPVAVPWEISPSVPNLKIGKSDDSGQVSATFVGHFKCDEMADSHLDPYSVQLVSEDSNFRVVPLSIKSPFKMVRINFVNCYFFRISPAVSDAEVIPEDGYDWSAVASSLMPNERIEDNVKRTRELWIKSEICPDPGMYEVENSPLLSDFSSSSNEVHHYLMLGHDEYIEVIAERWAWEAGQPVD